MVGRMQASTMAILTAEKSPTVTEYINATVNGSEKGEGNVNATSYASIATKALSVDCVHSR
jgi:hypothetical protein